jgi:hypothetical protein
MFHLRWAHTEPIDTTASTQTIAHIAFPRRGGFLSNTTTSKTIAQSVNSHRGGLCSIQSVEIIDLALLKSGAPNLSSEVKRVQTGGEDRKTDYNHLKSFARILSICCPDRG